jgi:hypothetical protein
LAGSECLAAFVGVGHWDEGELASLATSLEHMRAHVTRDSAEPRLDRSLAAIRGHRAMRAQQRLLHGFIGIGLRAEQRHARATEDGTMLACARGQGLSVVPLMEHREDRIWAGLVTHR